MSTKQPIIKFSPFEALLIGEKNRILKRQPMKNTIFVTRLNQQDKRINLRDLFGLEDISKPESNDVVFKMPQRVRDFLRTRKLRNKNSNAIPNKQEDILCYEFEGQKMIVKKKEKLKQISKKAKIKSNKVKFKKFKCKENLREKFAKRFHNHTRKRHCYRNRHRKVLPRLSPRDVKKKKYTNRHLLRGKDGKFICKSEYDSLNLKESSTKRKYLATYLHQLYLKKNKEFFHNNKLNNYKHLNNCQMPYKSVEVGFTDLKINSDQALPEIKKYFKGDSDNDFKFPKFPKQLAVKSDFEEDDDLIDLIYENFPKSIKFQCKYLFDDFSDALKNSGIVKREKNLKIYEKKKNESFKSQEVRVIFDHQIPCIHLRRLDNIKSNLLPLNSIRSGYGSVIDEPFTKNSQLITGKSIGSLFFRSVEGKDIFVGNLVKPFFQNSWFGSLPEF